MKIAILGLGEAGSHFANDLAALELEVSGWDPDLKRDLDGRVEFAENNPAAVSNADVVFSVNLSSVSESVAEEIKSNLKDDAVFCEMNTSSPLTKRRIGAILGEERVVDLAIMAPVPLTGIWTPMLASGKKGKHLEQIMNGKMNIEYLNENIGDAAGRKLLRSIVFKGMASVICEAMEAGEKLELEDYMREQIGSIIGKNDDLIDRFLNGTQQHAERRMHEMEAVVEMLENKKLSNYMSRATVKNLNRYII